MKNRFVFLLLFFLSLLVGGFGCKSTYPHATPEKLGKTVFKILQHQDPGGLASIVPTESDLESFLASADMPEEEMEAFRLEMKQILAEYAESAAQAYSKACDNASREGVLLAKSKMKITKVETREGPDNMLAEIRMLVEYQGKQFKLTLLDAGKVTSGWVLGLDGFSLVAVNE